MTPDDKWKAETFQVQTPNGIEDRTGLVYNGVGIIQDPRGGFWAVVHLNTGLVTQFLAACPNHRVILTDLAECIDWTFSKDGGWQNSQPDYLERLQAWRSRHDLGRNPVTDNVPPERKEDDARKIWMDRE